MMVGSPGFRSRWAQAVAIGLLTGCSVTPPNTAPPAFAGDPAPELTVLRLDQEGFAISQASSSAPASSTSALTLTADQEDQIRMIFRQAPTSDRLERLQQALLAPQIDAASLRALTPDSEAEITHAITTMLGVRAVLTPLQRQSLVKDLNKPTSAQESASADARVKAMRERLSLTPAQERAYMALIVAQDAYQKGYTARTNAAYATLLATGETRAMREAYREANRTRPMAEMIAYYRSLSLAQRQILFGSRSAGSPAASG